MTLSFAMLEHHETFNNTDPIELAFDVQPGEDLFLDFEDCTDRIMTLTLLGGIPGSITILHARCASVSASLRHITTGCEIRILRDPNNQGVTIVVETLRS